MEGTFDPVVKRFLAKLDQLNLTPFHQQTPDQAPQVLEGLQQHHTDWDVKETVFGSSTVIT